MHLLFTCVWWSRENPSYEEIDILDFYILYFFFFFLVFFFLLKYVYLLDVFQSEPDFPNLVTSNSTERLPLHLPDLHIEKTALLPKL